MSFPPEAFIIGAQKAGTTTLAYLLDQHPRICVSNPKETYFFTINWNHGLDWYRERFSGTDDAIFIDATPGYSMAIATGTGNASDRLKPVAKHRAAVPHRIHLTNPDAKFVYILRDPVNRTYSSYWHHVRAGDEKRPFRQAIEENPYYLSAGDYAYQVRQYLEYFELNSFLFLLFEDLCRDPVAVTQRCFAFLGVEPRDFTVIFDQPKNRSYRYNPVGQLVTRILPTHGVRLRVSRIARTLLPQSALNTLRSAITREIPNIDPDDRAYLIDFFRDRNRAFNELTGISTDIWQH